MTETTDLEVLTRPIIGIENRTAQEVFGIMCDRVRSYALPTSGAAGAIEDVSPHPSGEGIRGAAAGFHDEGGDEVAGQIMLRVDTALAGELSAWSTETMAKISTLTASVDGNFSIRLSPHNGEKPKGDRQDYEGPEVRGIQHEWVDQSGPGLGGDDFHGTVTFVLDDYHLVVEYA